MLRTSVGPFHPACLKCRKCAANLDQSSVSCGPDGDVYCALCYKEDFGVLARTRARSRSRSREGGFQVENRKKRPGPDIFVEPMYLCTAFK